ncbi:PH domain-containing protein [Catenuloplanes sp. NPDC051500]|uniref:PH domain-containing protein n=1 Tax=Catenuloplanes sp. NPDC051500 TaxID=3363959 RepID=UPI0037BD2D4B
MTQWRPVQGWRFGHVLVGLMFLFGVGILGVVTVGVLSAEDGDPRSLLAYPFIALWLRLVWQMGTTGLFVGPSGIRIRRLFRSRTVAWSEIARFVVAPGEASGGRDAIWVWLADGERLSTRVYRDTGLNVTRNRQDEVLSAERFDRVLEDLRGRLAVA